MCMCHVLSHIPLFATPWTVACQVPPYGVCQGRILEWVAIGNLPDPEIKPEFSASPALQADSLPTKPSGKPYFMHKMLLIK